MQNDLHFSFFQSHGKSVILAILILIVGYLLASVLKKRLRSFFKQHAADPTIQLFLVNTIYGLSLLLIGIIVLGQLGIPTASLITVLGAATIAVGLSLKDTLSNIAGGILLIFLRPFKIGDTVELKGVFGTVDEINLFTTRIKTPNNEQIYFPNMHIMNDKIVNKAHDDNLRRMDLAISIAYDADIKKVKAILLDLMKKDSRILQEPTTIVAVKALADSAIILAVRPWVKRQDYSSTQYDLLEAIPNAFNKNHINIPFPQLDVHLNKV